MMRAEQSDNAFLLRRGETPYVLTRRRCTSHHPSTERGAGGGWGGGDRDRQTDRDRERQERENSIRIVV